MSIPEQFCKQCGAAIKPGSRFCTGCGQPLRFCEQCGAVLDPQSRFCGQCGQPTVDQPAAAPRPAAPAEAPPPPVAPVPAAAPVAPAVSAEPVLGVIAYAEERSGLFRSTHYNLVFTPQRVIFATVTNQMLKDAARRAAEEAKQQGKGFFGRMAATMGSSNALWQRYLSMPVEQILAEHPENSFLPLNAIRRVRAKHVFDEDESTDTLTLETTSGKRQFTLKGTSAQDAKNFLRDILGDIVR